MLQSEPPLHHESSPSEDRPRRSRWTALGRAAEVALLVAAVLTVAGVALFSVKIATGVTRELGTPSEPVRLQIVNGSGVRGAETRLTQQLNGFTDHELNILVVEASSFDLKKVTHSFIVSRKQDDRSAKVLAAKLGLDPSGVIYEPLDNNVRSVGVTLVLGDDYHRLRSIGTQEKE